MDILSLSTTLMISSAVSTLFLAGMMIVLWRRGYGLVPLFWGTILVLNSLRVSFYICDRLGYDFPGRAAIADLLILVICFMWVTSCQYYARGRASLVWLGLFIAGVAHLAVGMIFPLHPGLEFWPAYLLQNAMNAAAIYFLVAGPLLRDFKGRLAITLTAWFTTNEVHYQYFLDEHIYLAVVFGLNSIGLVFCAIAAPFIFLQEVLTRLSEAERRFRALFENAADGIFQSMPDGTFLRINPAFARIFGYGSPQELMANKHIPSNHFYVDSNRREQLIAKALAEGGFINVESQVIRRDGVLIWINENLRIVRDAKDRILYFEGSVQDVTRRHEFEAALRYAKDQAETANQAKSHFLASMSHELRTPLNAILGFSEIMKKELFGKLGSDKYLEYSSVIRESGEHLLALINDILDVAKIESGKMSLKEEVCLPAELISKAVRIIQPRVQIANLNLVIDIPDDLPSMNLDGRMIQQALLNLLANAVKFTDRGGSITVTARSTDQFIEIIVSDNGIGMKAKDIPIALTPFAQLDSHLAKRQEGTGLGLPLAKAMVELHGGSLGIESALGKGTSARIVLPASRYIEKKDHATQLDWSEK